MINRSSTVIEVDNVTCGLCIRRIKQSLGADPGVLDLDVQLASGRTGLVTVYIDETRSSPQSLVNLLAESGYIGRIVSIGKR